VADTNQNQNNHEGHFYKGLFFGLLIEVGVIWLLNSDTGKEVVKKARRRIDEALAFEPGMEDYDFEDEEPIEPKKSSTSKHAPAPRRFFQKKSK
jgi:hypothetical protein